MPVQKLLAKIHIAKKDLALDDETYREILNTECGVRSAKYLTNEQALKIIRRFKDSGWEAKTKPNKGDSPSDGSKGTVPMNKKYDDPAYAQGATAGKPTGDIYSASPQIKRKIEAMWHDLYRGNHEKLHLRQWLFNKFKVSDVGFLDKRTAYEAVEALKAMQSRIKAQG